MARGEDIDIPGRPALRRLQRRRRNMGRRRRRWCLAYRRGRLGLSCKRSGPGRSRFDQMRDNHARQAPRLELRLGSRPRRDEGLEATLGHRTPCESCGDRARAPLLPVLRDARLGRLSPTGDSRRSPPRRALHGDARACRPLPDAPPLLRRLRLVADRLRGLRLDAAAESVVASPRLTLEEKNTESHGHPGRCRA